MAADLCHHFFPHAAAPHAQRRLNDAQILTTALIAARFFGGNLVLAQAYMEAHHGQAKLDKSSFNRRLHALADTVAALFVGLGEQLKRLNTSSQYVIDSLPVPICDNRRIKRSKRVGSGLNRGDLSLRGTKQSPLERPVKEEIASSFLLAMTNPITRI